MVTVAQADLQGKLDDIGPLHFVRVEWWKEAPRFALLRIAIEGKFQDLGLRLDLDKSAIIDRTGNESLDEQIQKQAPAISVVVAKERAAGGWFG